MLYRQQKYFLSTNISLLTTLTASLCPQNQGQTPLHITYKSPTWPDFSSLLLSNAKAQPQQNSCLTQEHVKFCSLHQHSFSLSCTSSIGSTMCQAVLSVEIIRQTRSLFSWSLWLPLSSKAQLKSIPSLEFSPIPHMGINLLYTSLTVFNTRSLVQHLLTEVSSSRDYKFLEGGAQGVVYFCTVPHTWVGRHYLLDCIRSIPICFQTCGALPILKEREYYCFFLEGGID